MTPLLDARAVAIEGRLHRTDLIAGPGELVALIGPNGGGKTSLLRAIAAIDGSRASVIIEGEALDFAPPARRARLAGFLPASRDVAWPIAARDLIALGLPVPNPGRVEALIAMLELEALADRPSDRLSTGERTRVLLARALAARPRLLLLDEPLSNLDPYWVLRILSILEETVRREQCSALVAVHDLGVVERFDRTILVHGGRIVADGPPGIVLESEALAGSFRIRKAGSSWRIKSPEDPRSLP